MKIKALCDIVEQGNPGIKFKRMFEDMRKKLRVDEKIQVDLGLKLDNSKLDEKILNEKVTPKFNELGEEYDRKEKFRRIFKNSYHKIIISFFSMMIALKKNKQDFAVVFRFFGHDQADIEEFIYEFNCFVNAFIQGIVEIMDIIRSNMILKKKRKIIELIRTHMNLLE